MVDNFFCYCMKCVYHHFRRRDICYYVFLSVKIGPESKFMDVAF
jgi:hypothetical protein